jgi:hypothetical protein
VNFHKCINDVSQMMFNNCDVGIVRILFVIVCFASNTFMSRVVFGGFGVDGSLNSTNSRVKKRGGCVFLSLK